MTDTGTPRGKASPQWLIEIAAAFADLGTFLPLVTGLLLLGGFEPTGVLFGFGGFAVVTGLTYRCPISAQPMKAVAALAITGQLAPSAGIASGLLIGLALLALAASGAIAKLERMVPRTVLFGLQLGLGLSLISAAARLPGADFGLSAAALVFLGALLATPLRSLGCLVMVVGGTILALTAPGADVPAFEIGFWLPHFALPETSAMRDGLQIAVLPQLAMTLTNAVLLTATLAREHFPDNASRVTPTRLAQTTGALNILLAPFGAIPMCHGAGGVAAMQAMGARTGLAPAIFGFACLALAVVLGPAALHWLQTIPLEIVAALLAFAGLQLAKLPRVQELKPTCLAIIATTAASALFVNVAAGLVVGLAAELLRAKLQAVQQQD